MKKINITFGFLFGCFLICSVLCLTFISLKSLDVLNMEYEERITSLNNPNIVWHYDCQTRFLSSYYNCPRNLSFQNITGLYCDNVLLCKNDYMVLR